MKQHKPSTTSGHSEISMRSLAPSFDAEQHETYVARLEAAVEDDRNRNIALTGSYGTGKSSILDEYCRRQGTGTLRLNISTLGASTADETLTNRLQKEVVKQLLYSAKPTTVRNSHFKRIRSMPRGQAIWESVAATAVIGLLLWLTGMMPSITGTEPGRHAALQVVAWITAGALATLVFTVVRLVTFDRFVVAAVGGAVTLREKTSTYFDDYLDEIVNYFDTTKKRIVVFEDLDRFDDPKIFEALRELNIILNNTPARRADDEPLRFVYAVKDSLFERLGGSGDPDETDAAALENQRANRTKFFDLVIPVVPFISHRNARELLFQLLTDAEIDDIPRELVDLVATHTTDMRLLINLCNEYVVFAERLLDSERVAPDLKASNLFALVAYKMFHMRDFECISRHRSRLDQLYAEHRRVVRAGIEERQVKRREIAAGRGRAHSRADRATMLGQRLRAMSEAVATSRNQSNATLDYVVDENAHNSAAVIEPAFWAAVATGEELVARSQLPRQAKTPLFTMSAETLHDAFPEMAGAESWAYIDQRETEREIARVEAEIAHFRGAGFRELLEISDDFAESLTATLTSELARDLVRRGYLTRHFGTYAAQFYGDFTGVDVATYIMQTVETNSIDIDYEFTTEGAVANLLAEVGEGFTKTISALNTDIVDHLLRTEDPRRDDVARQIIERDNEHRRTFLNSYVNFGADASRLIARLAVLGWSRLLVFLVTDDAVPDDIRVTLIDGALSTEASMTAIETDEAVSDFLTSRYTELDAFTTINRDTLAQPIADLVERLDWAVPALADVTPSLQRELLDRRLYAVTPDNLRIATGGERLLSLDVLLSHPDVYEHAVASADNYLRVIVDEHAATPHSIEQTETLLQVLTDVEERWTSEQMARLLGASSETARLDDVTAANESHWDRLARADLLRPSVSNVAAFVERDGVVESPVAGLLQRAGYVDDDLDPAADESAAIRMDVAVAIINAGDHIDSLSDRIDIVLTIDDVGFLPAEQVRTAEPTALASLLSGGLVDDTLAVFSQLRPTTWIGMQAALQASSGAVDFVTPELLEGFVAQLFTAAPVADTFGPRILRELPTFVGDDDHAELAAAGRYAAANDIALPIAEILRIAKASRDQPRLTMQLLANVRPTPTTDDLVQVLAALGDPYTRLSTGGDKFNVPHDDDFRHVFDELKAAGRCRLRKKNLKPVLQVWPSGLP